MKRVCRLLRRQSLLVALFVLSVHFCGNLYLPGIAAADILSVTTAGSGTGTVNSTPAGITCESGISTNCSASFANSSEITLTATTDWKSLFGGWSTPCSGTGSCVFTINGDSGVTATFNPNYQATVLGHSVVEYATLSEAYANTSADGFFAAHEHTFMENLTIDRDIAVTFYGGMGEMYLTNFGFTTLQGALEVQQGAVAVDALIIQ